MADTTGTYASTPFDPYVTKGLDVASGMLDQSQATPFQYPSYVPSQQQAPTTQNYYQYQPTAPLAQIQAPSYNPSAGQYTGLMGGDYDKLQQSIYNPQAQAAQTGYNQATNNLQNVMGGRGMYGSSVMQNQQTQGLDTTYQNALQNAMANAVQQRYALQSQEGQFGYQAGANREAAQNQFALQNAALEQAQNQATYNANANEAARQMQYGQGQMNWNQNADDLMRQWQNQQNYEKFTYNLAQQQAQQAYQANQYNQALALAGQGAPMVNQAQAYNTTMNNLQQQQALANQNARIQSQTGWLGAAGSAVGGLMTPVAQGGTTVGANILDAINNW